MSISFDCKHTFFQILRVVKAVNSPILGTKKSVHRGIRKMPSNDLFTKLEQPEVKTDHDWAGPPVPEGVFLWLTTDVTVIYSAGRKSIKCRLRFSIGFDCETSSTYWVK